MSSQALQDKYGRGAVFGIRFALTGASDNRPQLIQAISSSGAVVMDMMVRDADAAQGQVSFNMSVFTAGDDQMATAMKAAESVEGVKILEVLDMAMESHRGGSCEMRSRQPINSNTDLRIVYTPGVARVCKAIEKDPSKARDFTNIANKVAIATNGTAILGLGDIGCLAGLPVMEGKSAIFWEFTKLSAEPILINTKNADEFINIVEKLAIGFGAIQIEDVAAPDCFKITRELDKRLDIPVMHDDQHGTATVVMAGLFSAIRKTNRKLSDIRCVICGAGAAGTAIGDLLLHEGVADVILCDRTGALYRGRKEQMNPEKVALAERTNKDNAKGSLADVMKGRNLFIGVSQANIVSKDMVRSMEKDPIIFALANPVSEISRPDAMEAGAVVYADGRMMNNALAYPGIFRGTLDSGAKKITVQMVVAAAKALANCAGDALMPEMMSKQTHMSVIEAVKKAAGPGDLLCR